MPWFQQPAEASSRSPCRGAIVQVAELGDIDSDKDSFQGTNQHRRAQKSHGRTTFPSLDLSEADIGTVGKSDAHPEETRNPDLSTDPVDVLREAAPSEDADGNPIWPQPERKESSRKRHPNCSQPPRRSSAKPFAPRPSRQETERRIAEAQLWIAQRLPLIEIRDNAARNWGITNTKTVSRYLALARERMVEELISNRLQHQAEQIFALNELARRAMDKEQFNAAVGAYRVIAEIGGMLRAPLKAPENRS